MADTITVTGLKEAQRALYSYSQQLGDRVVLGALRQGANLVKRAAQSNAPVKTGKLKRGIRVAKSKIHRGQLSDGLIGVYLTIPNKKKGDPFYGRFQEDGWNTKGASTAGPLSVKKVDRWLIARQFGGRTGRKTQSGRQHVLGKKFIDRAFTEKREAAVDLIVQTATAGADLLARKLGL
jgi:HK97 gp10 family phage protein